VLWNRDFTTEDKGSTAKNEKAGNLQGGIQAAAILKQPEC
jgi:hypothetical protein